MDTLAIIIIAGLMTIVILVLIVRNTMLSNRITDTAIENDRLKRENHNLEKVNDELNDELDEVTGGNRHRFRDYNVEQTIFMNYEKDCDYCGADVRRGIPSECTEQ